MYGLIGKMTAVAGQRDALASILLQGTGEMPGCLSYVIAKDPTDGDARWLSALSHTSVTQSASPSVGSFAIT